MACDLNLLTKVKNFSRLQAVTYTEVHCKRGNISVTVLEMLKQALNRKW